MRTTSFDNFRRCADDAPEGCYEHAKSLSALIGETCDTFMRDLRSQGLLANNCDMAYQLEAALYDYAKASNPDHPMFPTAEGFGDSMNGPARERVLAQSASNLEALRTLGLA